MSNYGRLMGTFGLALLLAVMVQLAPVQAGQVGAIKDAWLVMKVHSEFVNEDVLSGSNIDVDVKDGMVTLQGTVASEAARSRAVELAKKNDGVKGVTDQLRIAPPVKGTMDKASDAAAAAGSKTAEAGRKTARAIDDGWIKSKIYAQFMADWNTVLDDSDIDVDVESGMVTLNGTVKSAEAKTRAATIARETTGVKNVSDKLRVSTTR
jgi:hyperosmotically inducible periplasmic protein